MPITGIDHIMIAVPDLAAAAGDLAAATGLRADRHAVHPTFGTANRVTRVPGLYLELITVVDRELAGGFHVGQRMAEVIADDGGPLAFVLGTRDLVATVDELTATGLPIDEPFGGSGVRDDGSTIRSFWIAGHGEEFRTGRLPSLIEYGQPGEDDPVPDDLGYRLHGLARVDVAVSDLDDGIDRYATLFGRAPARGVDRVLDVPTAEFTLPDRRAVRLIGPGPAKREGLFGMALGVADLDEALDAVRARGVGTTATGVGGEVLLDPARTMNTRISLLATAAPFATPPQD
jgi:catechol 2,3-dioxygenase-like lactoylglutathione lyase family enzyme